ncbi:MAG: GNAT family N-acetyltransferase [Marinirhabdus sp.]
MDLKIELLKNNLIKKSFSCGHPMLDNYIQKQAKQDIKRDLSACFVLTGNNREVVGYYTLSANAISRDDFPQDIVQKLPPSYLNLPTILMSRLAVDENFKGNGFGELILMDALDRCVKISQNLGTLAIVVDPIDAKAEAFYSKYGFILIPGTGKMLIPIKTIENAQ